MISNPAIKALIAQIVPELVWAQVLIQRVAPGFELRHVDDRSRDGLRTVDVEQLQALAQVTAAGAFRALKSSPNLQAGWRFAASDEAALESALSVLYPGSVADWFAAQSPRPPVTHYRDFTNRQSGMYRITQMLDDAQAAAVIRAGCHAAFCLKRRLWTVDGLAGDAAAEKSLIPCLEPCAVLLEFARKAVRIEQSEKCPVAFTEDEVESLRHALQQALASSEVREGDTNHPGNPRRLRLLLDRLELLPKKPDNEAMI